MQKINAAKADIELVEQAIQAYFSSVGEYPPCLEALILPPPNSDKWPGPFLKEGVPHDPWGNQYQYLTPGTHNPDSFDIWTVSPEGLEIGNWPSGTHAQNTMAMCVGLERGVRGAGGRRWACCDGDARKILMS